MKKEKEFELKYCSRCIQMTNHGCCKCSFKKGRSEAIKDELEFLKEQIKLTEEDDKIQQDEFQVSQTNLMDNIKDRVYDLGAIKAKLKEVKECQK